MSDALEMDLYNTWALSWPSAMGLRTATPAVFSTRRCWPGWHGCRCSRGGRCMGNVSGQHRQPASRLERRVCRVSQVRARRRPAAARLAGVRPLRPALHQGVRGRHEPALLPGRRHQRLDGVRLDGTITKIEYAKRIAGALGYLAVQQGDAVGLACVADGIVTRNSAAAQSGASGAGVRFAGTIEADGRNAAGAAAARAGRDDPPAGAGRHHFRFVRRPGRSCAVRSSTFASASTTWPCSTCSIRWNWASSSIGRCGFSTWKAVPPSSPSRTKSPTAITRRWAAISHDLQQVVARNGGRLPPRQHR